MQYGGAVAEALCCRAGVFNETIFRTVDTILDAASRAGLRVIVALVDNWQELDGVPSYLNVRTHQAFILPESGLFENGAFWLDSCHA